MEVGEEGGPRFDSASALLSLQKGLWFVDTVLWLCPSSHETDFTGLASSRCATRVTCRPHLMKLF